MKHEESYITYLLRTKIPMFHIVYARTVNGDPEFMSFKTEKDLRDFVYNGENDVADVYNVYVGVCDESLADELHEKGYRWLNW